ncbi:MAG TPA: hypothetical protein VJ947_06680, partial [Pseudohaliea sp.]|nr:hypothetical protein [Pseudohaliea sp.]
CHTGRNPACLRAGIHGAFWMGMWMDRAFRLLLLSAALAPAASAQPVAVTDLAALDSGDGRIERVHGSVGNGAVGVPVAGGHDLDGDGHVDTAFAAMLASPLGRDRAGQVFLVFGDGIIGGTSDTAQADPDILELIGDQAQENAGSEIWIDDVTGDGLGDLLICRQNFSPDGGSRIGAGALTIVPGQAALRVRAALGQAIDLRAIPAGLEATTLLGARAGERLGIWVRTGDVTGDGIADLVVGADRRDEDGANDSGTAYVVRGGSNLQGAGEVDLAEFGATVLVGNIARIRPPAGSSDFHFGATVQIADLDGNGRAEVLAAAALNRAGASLPPLGGSGNGSGGAPDGTVYIAWDDNFTGNWLPPPDFVVGDGPGAATVINGSADNTTFGEELLGALDYDHDGSADVFVGDLTAGGWDGISRGFAGTGHVIYDAASLKGLSFDLDAPPPGFAMATFLGPVAGAIAGDTALHGDFDGDGIDDLAFSSPHANPLGRTNAGTLHVLLGRVGRWPEFSDLAAGSFPDAADVAIHEIYGAFGNSPQNTGDTLAYSAASGDLNGDGTADLIVNEMTGDGLAPDTIDVGNLLLIDGGATLARIFADGFED